MSKKLLTGVLALSILLIGNTAVFSIAPDGKRTAQPLPTSNSSAVLFGQDDVRSRLTEKLQKEVATEAVDLTGAVLTKSFVPTFACVDQDNTCYPCGWGGLSFRNSGALGGLVPAVGNKYFVQDNFLCSLNGTWMFLGAVDGDIDIEIGIWAGAGPNPSIPATQVGSVIVNSLTLSAGAWNFFDLTSLGLTFTEDFFVTFGSVIGSAVDAGGPETDRVQAVIDNTGGLATEPRTGVTLDSSVPGWTTNDLFWAQYYNQVASAIVCCQEIPFTDCFLNTHADSYSFIFSLPSTGNCRKGVAMRYSTGGFDTLLVAEISLSDFFSGTDPDGEVILEMLADDGAGVPDASSPLAPSLTIGGVGLGADLYPLGSFGWVDYPINIVPGPSVTYHIAVRWTGPDPAVTGFGSGIGADDFTAGEGNVENVASVFWPDGVIDVPYGTCPPPLTGWNNYFAAFGTNPDFLVDINVCNDEFVTCELLSNAGNLTFFSTFFMSDGFSGFSGAYAAGGDECRIDIASIPIFGYDDLTGMEVGVYLDAAGAPGAAAYSEIVPQTAFPFGNGTGQGVGFIDIFPNAGAGVQVMGAYHVVARPQWGTTIADPIYQILISDGSDPVNGHYEFGGSWFPSDAVFGSGNNYYTESFRCCVPFNERVCTPGDDWPTYQHDQQRTGASFNALGEANCNLNVLWTAQSSAGNSFSGSVIFGDKVLISDDNGFDCRLLTDGSLVWDQDTDPTVSGLFAGALGNRTQPTVGANAALGIDLAILGTGLNRDVVAVNAATGAYVWHNTTNSPFPGLAPNATEVKSIMLFDGFDDILFYATQNKLYAVIAATGVPCPFWATNPITLAANNVNALTTNDAGFFSSQIVVPTFNGAIPGNIESFDASSGALLWDLATVTGAVGLQAAVDGRAGYVNNEGFFSGASYDKKNDVFWANSFFDADFPAEGYLYRIAANGSAYTTARSVRSQRATPVIDENQIYVPAFTKWVNPINSGEQIYSRATGNLAGTMQGNQSGDRQWSDGVLSCEPGVDDIYIHGTENGDLNFYTVGNTNALSFYRQTTTSGFVQGQWVAGSLAPDVVVFTNFGGLTVALAPGANRPRLAIISPAIDVPVPFGTPNGTDVTFPNAFTNTGCADLTINAITFTDPTPPSGTAIEFTAVDPALRAKMDEQATYSTNSRLFMKIGLMMGEAAAGTDPFSSYQASDAVNSSLNYRAAVLPDVVDGTTGDNGLISPSAGDLIAPGDIVDLHIAINGPLVTRGPHPFTAHLDTDDLDYFMDDTLGVTLPSIALRVIGGCLEDSVRITFGIGGANSTTVYNDGVIARFTGNSANDVDIDGFQEGGSEGAGGTLAELFGGLRGWSLTPRRVSMTGPSWDGDDYGSILGDPNYCGNTCVPTLQSNVLLGSMSSDNGATYSDVFGDLAAATYIDSAQDYSDGLGGWATDNFPDLFSVDSTIGIIVNETHYGALDVAELANFRLVRVDVTNRSAVNSIDDLVHFAVHDDDIGSNNASNTVQGRPSKGYLYNTSPNEPVVHGYVRVPFGCGVTETITGIAGDAPASWWNFESVGFYDSLYQYGHGGTDSIHFQPGMNTFAGDAGSPSDASADFFFGSVNLAPSETKSFGFAEFAFTGSSTPPLAPQVAGNDDQYIGFADMVNKWAGFGRGDVNNDMSIDLADVVYLAGTVGGGNGAYPFAHLGDVNNDGAVDAADVAYLKDYYFNCGPCPVSDWALGLCAP